MLWICVQLCSYLKWSYFFSSVEPEKGLAEGEAQVQIGRMMPLIQVIG